MKTIVITGSNRGIGLELSRQLGLAGFNIICLARTQAKADQAASQLKNTTKKNNFTPYECDVTSSSQIQALANQLRTANIQLDGLINNAGILINEDTHDIAQNRNNYLKSFETNTLAPLELSMALKDRFNPYSQIINISSGLSQLSTMGKGYPSYRLSKTALNAVTCLLSQELSDKQIQVNSICPGWVKTDMGGPNAPRTVEDSAKTITWLFTNPHTYNANFLRDHEIIPW